VAQRCRHDNRIENPELIVSVPSGNFGNLTSGLMARTMGAPIKGFIAATNSNRTIPDWLYSGEYTPRPSVATLSNAMDVGAPSNFERMNSMYSLEDARDIIAGYWLDDKGTLAAIQECYRRTGYIIDPHGAVAWKAWTDIREGAMNALRDGKSGDPGKPGLTPIMPGWAGGLCENRCVGIVLETAHPAKFGETVYKAIGREPSMPSRLEQVLHLSDRSIPLEADYRIFRQWLFDYL
jgi:threonine synthase